MKLGISQIQIITGILNHYEKNSIRDYNFKMHRKKYLIINQQVQK